MTDYDERHSQSLIPFRNIYREAWVGTRHSDVNALPRLKADHVGLDDVADVAEGQARDHVDAKPAAQVPPLDGGVVNDEVAVVRVVRRDRRAVDV